MFADRPRKGRARFALTLRQNLVESWDVCCHHGGQVGWASGFLFRSSPAYLLPALLRALCEFKTMFKHMSHCYSVVVGKHVAYFCLLWFSGWNPTTWLPKNKCLLPFQRQPRS